MSCPHRGCQLVYTVRAHLASFGKALPRWNAWLKPTMKHPVHSILNIINVLSVFYNDLLSSWWGRTCRLLFMVSCGPVPPPQCSWFSREQKIDRRHGDFFICVNMWCNTAMSQLNMHKLYKQGCITQKCKHCQVTFCHPSHPNLQPTCEYWRTIWKPPIYKIYSPALCHWHSLTLS